MDWPDSLVQKCMNIQSEHPEDFDPERLRKAIKELARFDPAMARGVEMRFFEHRSVQDTAQALELTRRTFERKWNATRQWLRKRLELE